MEREWRRSGEGVETGGYGAPGGLPVGEVDGDDVEGGGGALILLRFQELTSFACTTSHEKIV